MYQEITPKTETFSLKTGFHDLTGTAGTNTDKEALGNGLEIFISKDHRFGTDALLLAEFAAPRRKDSVIDLGTGCGIIPFLLLRDFGVKAVTAVDINAEAIELLKQSVKANNIGSIFPLCADLRALSSEYNGEFDVVTCNPPYKAVGTGIVSKTEAELLARHEVSCTQEDVCKASYKLLKSGGRLCMINRTERLADVICAMRKNRIEPKRLRMVAKDENTKPVLFLIEGKKDAKPFTNIECTKYTNI
ncbi:MAG: methyltransferase [Ruminococcus sp.]|jgi:tRNA1(Val) A37 N6-methylase TrmN6|nr:methyltransferase [Ruminococcus sp.]